MKIFNVEFDDLTVKIKRKSKVDLSTVFMDPSF